MDTETAGYIVIITTYLGLPGLFLGGWYYNDRRKFKKKLPSLEAAMVGQRICENLSCIEKAVKEKDYASARKLFQERQTILGEIGNSVERAWYLGDYAGKHVNEALCKGNKLEESLYVLETAGI